ncbi:YdiU family protein [Sporosarcina sp. PTS2304]|uniref:protein adenylyltransferase SelO n=1 Tax=Sporosarcina sp. PTS2304 TaxID=2283194 RepID=UPI000E0D166E|nr:YdiU family protein [Sporosarcina sp. PTS2304]AXI00610.1 YdiU family protein [Sporosarcina sp. PTS2304]
MKNNNSLSWNIECSFCQLPQAFYTSVSPNSVSSPQLVLVNDQLADSLGIDPQQLNTPKCISIFAGNEGFKGVEPIAQAYAGHQFGNFTMLGDGRAMLLGELITAQGKRVDIQLKGSGRTPYSRGGDGRAALGPMLREYMISEAMHGLGIPTTRSLAVTVTGEPVLRETALTGAVLTRVAASHLRVGTFQYAAARENIEELRELADYTINRHMPSAATEKHPYVALLEGVIARQASLIAKWQAVGFIHGVMNTDNMTISGETIDYGPCAFIDTYNPATVFSSIDVQGRYSYRNQPGIAEWNVTRFAETLLPLLHEDREEAVTLAEGALSQFARLYVTEWLEEMRAKLGLFTKEEEDETLITDLLDCMKKHEADYTNTFRSLTVDQTEKFFSTTDFIEWKEQWIARLKRQPHDQKAVKERMKQHNPSIIPRNYYVEEALAMAEKGDLARFATLLHALENPFAYTKEQEEYVNPPRENTSYQTYCGT